MDPVVESDVNHIAACQYGLITHQQAVEAGVGPRSIQRLHDRQAWIRVAPAVYRLAGVPSSWHQDVLLAVLSVADEAVASHQTAAILWELADRDRYPVHVATTRPRWRGRHFVLHRSTDLAEPYVTVTSDIPVTTPARTILDLGGSAHPRQTERALDAALRQGLTSYEEMAEIVTDLGRQGRNGVRVVRGLVEARARWAETTESELEDQFRRLLVKEGLPFPLAQREISDSRGVIGRVDFAYPDRRLLIELDGYAYHSDPAAFTRDRERQNRLLMVGYRVLRYTAADLRGSPGNVIAQLRQALRVSVNRDSAQRH
ncbi:MAG: DUF559 domain-containing protein [Acidimicrobiia bacterium]